ncbi:LytTr DNA-binding domain-containing protein [Spirosomataceae bacterium TFI 002]|nr:LytTr DNA-binding domain-containing protein [Spirosomataceae bacterium TFI 002]
MKANIHLGARTSSPSHEIIKLEAQDNYTIVHFIDGSKLLTSTTIGTLEKRLQPFHFFRTSRSTVINLDYLYLFKVHYGSNGSLEKTTKNDIFLARRRKAAFEAEIGGCINCA